MKEDYKADVDTLVVAISCMLLFHFVTLCFTASTRSWMWVWNNYGVLWPLAGVIFCIGWRMYQSQHKTRP